MYDTLDGTFPHHEANPLKTETLADLQQKVRRLAVSTPQALQAGTGLSGDMSGAALAKTGHYDFGVAFDGDADRVGFVDETGAIVPMDMITLLIAQSILKKHKGVILYDLRSSWTVREVIEENGGTPQMCRVGHAFIKQQMRAAHALFAGELSGHYYFQENYFTESSAMAVLYIANLLSQSQEPLSAMIKPFHRYFKSSEINSEVKDPPTILARLKNQYRNGKQFELDGLSVEYPDGGLMSDVPTPNRWFGSTWKPKPRCSWISAHRNSWLSSVPNNGGTAFCRLDGRDGILPSVSGAQHARPPNPVFVN